MFFTTAPEWYGLLITMLLINTIQTIVTGVLFGKSILPFLIKCTLVVDIFVALLACLVSITLGVWLL